MWLLQKQSLKTISLKHFKNLVRCPLLGLGLHPSLALWLAFPPLRHGGGHLPELVGGVVLAPPLRGHGGHLPELVGGVVHTPRLLGLDLHPSLALWLAFPPVHHGG